jgi:ATP-dependent helicase/nuclease subunit A
VRLLFLPPFSPDYNPIEKTWANMKHDLRNKRYNTAGQALHPRPAAAFRGKPRGIKPFGSSLARSCACKHARDLAPFVNKGRFVFPEEPELRDYCDQLTGIPHEAVIEWAESHPVQEKLLHILQFLSSLYKLDMRKGSPRNNPAKVILNELRDVFGEFSSLVVFCKQAGLIYSVLTLLSDLQRRYLNRKRAEGIVTFSDIARLAKTILLEQHDIRQSEKESFKAIMIDEFQDNNELQKDLLFLLAEDNNIFNDSVPQANDLSAGKLFFVGDEKQSIYRFRGADVSVFRKLKTELGSKDLPLKTNYRSAPLLIGAFNTIFGEYPAVFSQEENLPPYEASYTPLRAHKESKGKLTLCILDKQDTAANDLAGALSEEQSDLLPATENEARYIAERIKTLLEEANETGGQKYQPHDIAILFRSRSPQRIFEKHLMLLNIPYASEDLSGFFFGGPVNDMMAVLRLAAYPADRAAYAQMLRSPFAGLSLPGLAICLAAPDSEPFGGEALALLAGGDGEKYLRGQCVYRKITGKACTESISSLVSELWYGEGYRYETEWNPQTAVFRELYDYLFHLAVKADEENKGLAAFTDFILNMDTTDERLSDIEVPLERPSAVRLMTVHKSKGLEFPVVFLVCCDKKGLNDYSDDIFDTGNAGLTLNPPLPAELETIKDIKRNYFWERSVAVENGKRTAELRRLLYVGMTRAENELYLSGCLGISKYLGIDNPDSGDFSLNVKHFIDTKIGEKNKDTENDAILEGYTFFGLCLPAFGAHIPEESAPSFFSVEQIPSYSEQYIRNTEQQGSRFSNDQNGLYSFFMAAEPFYHNAQTIETPNVPKRHFAPTALSPKTAEIPVGFTVNSAYSGEDAADVFDKVDMLLRRYAKQTDDGEQFNYAGFGTIAHICTEALLSNREAVIPPGLAGFLSPAEAEVFLEAGKALARRFTKSPLGVITREAEKRKSEFPFRSLLVSEGNEFFINGTIDLVFEDANTVYVVDFKTDSEENPGAHITQMACYYRAASDLFAVPANKDCRVWIYYLRTGHAVDVTDQARGFRISIPVQ